MGKFTIPKPILVMSIPVTEYLWTRMTGVAPRRIGRYGDESPREIEINGTVYELFPNHPVYGATWYSAAIFANEYSLLNDLPEAYEINPRCDKSTIEDWRSGEWRGWHPGNGGEFSCVYPAGGQRVTDNQGFRLPTSLEMNYLFYLATRGDFRDWSDSAVHSQNSDGRIWEVASRKPVKINGRPAFDIVGNTREWVSDGVEGDSEVGPHSTSGSYMNDGGHERSVFAPDFESGVFPEEYQSSIRRSMPSNSLLSFRLVRSLSWEEYEELMGERGGEK